MDEGVVLLQVHPVGVPGGLPAVPEGQVGGPVVAEQQPVAPARLAQGGDGVHPGLQSQILVAEAEAIHAQPAAPLQHGGEVLQIGGVSAVAQDHLGGGHAAAGQQIQDLPAVFDGRVVVAEQGQAGLLRHPAGGVEDLAQQRGEARPGHAGLENARPAVGAGDAVHAVPHQQVVDLLLVPHAQPGLLLIVEAGGGDEVQAGAPGHLPDQVDIPPQVDGGAVHHGAHTQGLGLVQLALRHGRHLVKVEELPAEVHPHRPVRAGQMLVYQGLPQLRRVDGAENSLDRHCTSPLNGQSGADAPFFPL